MSLLPLSPPLTRSAIEAAQLRKPIATMQKRTRACSALGLSFRDRTFFYLFMFYPFRFIITLLYCPHPLFIAPITP